MSNTLIQVSLWFSLFKMKGNKSVANMLAGKDHFNFFKYCTQNKWRSVFYYLLSLRLSGSHFFNSYICLRSYSILFGWNRYFKQKRQCFHGINLLKYKGHFKSYVGSTIMLLDKVFSYMDTTKGSFYPIWGRFLQCWIRIHIPYL